MHGPDTYNVLPVLLEKNKQYQIPISIIARMNEYFQFINLPFKVFFRSFYCNIYIVITVLTQIHTVEAQNT